LVGVVVGVMLVFGVVEVVVWVKDIEFDCVYFGFGGGCEVG